MHVQLPEPFLIGPLIAGVAWGLLFPGRPLEIPQRVEATAQALLGVIIGSQLRPSALAAIAGQWAPIALVTAGTVVASILLGLLVAALTGVDRSTSLLGSIAGAAEGVVGLAGGLGADVRLVATMQYLRVLVVVLVAGAVGGALHGEVARPAETATAGALADLGFTAACAAAGLLVACRWRSEAAALLAPLAIAGALAGSGLAGGAEPPPALVHLTFAIIGLGVGLRFTPASIRRAARLLPVLLGSIALLLVICFGLALGLAALTGERLSDSVLAATPGGLAAVLAIAVANGANVGFVLAVQSSRLILMLVLAPSIVRQFGSVRPPTPS